MGEWEERNGSEITSKITKGSSPNWQGFNYVEKGILFVTSENVRDGYLDVDSPKFLPIGFHEKQKNSQLKKGDLLINIVGASIGRSTFFDLDEPANINQAVAIFRLKSDFSKKYISYYLQLESTQKRMFGVQSESARPNLSLKNLNDLDFFLPTLPEQQKIAHFLTAIDEKINQLTCQKSLLEQYKKGVMQGIFSRELRFRDAEGRAFGEWEVKRLGEVGIVIRGASPRPKGDPLYYGGTIPRLMVEDVTRDGKYVTPCVDFLTEKGAQKSRPCKKGTLVIVCSGTVGIPAILAVDACIHDGFLALINIEKNCSIDFLYHQLTTLREKFEQSATHGGVFTNLTTSVLKDFIVAFPALPEQQKIADFLTALDEKISRVAGQVEAVKGYKKGLLQGMFV